MNLLKNNEAADQLTEPQRDTANREIIDSLLDEINDARRLAGSLQNDPAAFAAVGMIEEEISQAFKALQMESRADVVIAYHRLKKLHCNDN